MMRTYIHSIYMCIYVCVSRTEHIYACIIDINQYMQSAGTDAIATYQLVLYNLQTLILYLCERLYAIGDGWTC